MDCGIPFCHNGCPLGNLIPEWNDLARRGQWDDAIDRLHATNNFPEFTGRLCPAPCEAACVLGIADDPVTIKQVEVTIIDRAWDDGLRHAGAGRPSTPASGSPSSAAARPGLAAAQQLTRAGHERRRLRAQRPHRRPAALRHPRVQDGKAGARTAGSTQMEAEGTTFVTGCNVGVDLTVEELRDSYDAVVLAVGFDRRAATCRCPGRELDGHPPRDGVPRARRTGCRKATSRCRRSSRPASTS